MKSQDFLKKPTTHSFIEQQHFFGFLPSSAAESEAFLVSDGIFGGVSEGVFSVDIFG